MTDKMCSASTGIWCAPNDWSPTGVPQTSDTAPLVSGTLDIGNQDAGTVTDGGDSGNELTMALATHASLTNAGTTSLDGTGDGLVSSRLRPAPALAPALTSLVAFLQLSIARHLGRRRRRWWWRRG
jgi:hypothetical protein